MDASGRLPLRRKVFILVLNLNFFGSIMVPFFSIVDAFEDLRLPLIESECQKEEMR